jgi:hypothetical protein
VAEAPVAHEIHHHVLVEFHAVVERDLRHEAHRVGVVTVHVQDRHLQHLRDIRAVERGACIAQVRAGESDLVVDDDVERAPGAVAARLRELEGLHVDALSRERRIAVDEHRQHLVPRVVAAAVLARAHRPLDHRIDDLEMGGIERERDMHRPARRRDVGRKTLVVLDVAGEQVVMVLALELGEQVLGHLAQGVDQHVDAAAVGHADDELLHARPSRVPQQVVELRDQRLAAFQREALLADVAGVEILLERFRRGQALKDVFPVLRVIGRRRADRFQPLLHPALLRHIGDVHVFDADGPAVGVLEEPQDVRELHLPRPDQRAGIEHRPHVGLGQPVERGVELGDAGFLPSVERVDVGVAHPEEPVRRNELEHAELLLPELRAGDEHGRAGSAPFLRQPCEAILHLDMGHIRGAALDPLQLLEVVAPARLDRGRILEPGVVERLDERRVRAEQMGIGKELLHHDITPRELTFSCSWEGIPGAQRPRRAAADGRSSGRGRRSARSTGQSSPRCAPARKWR